MKSQAEAASWANLQQELEGKLTTWNVPYPEHKAEVFIHGLREAGWRTPLPDHRARTETWNRPRPVRTEASQRYIAACRDAIRAAADA